MFWIRWRFDYPNKTVCGIWNNSGDEKTGANQAWNQNKEGLVRAVIERKDIRTDEIKAVAICPGQEYRNMQWVGAVSLNPFAVGKAQTHKPRLCGLRLLARDTAIEVYGDGSIKQRPLTDSEKNINFATYGK